MKKVTMYIILVGILLLLAGALVSSCQDKECNPVKCPPDGVYREDCVGTCCGG